MSGRMTRRIEGVDTIVKALTGTVVEAHASSEFGDFTLTFADGRTVIIDGGNVGATVYEVVGEPVFETETSPDDKPVARCGDYRWTRGELDLLFKRVANKENWKLPIDARVKLASERDVYGVREAVIFYTGSVPVLTKLAGDKSRVQAAGYYETIGS